MKYGLVNKVTGNIVEGIIIDESAKEEFMEMMSWKEDDWYSCTREIK